ncbi:SAV_915 family protein [Mycetocola saprophilus]|uniref:SAV_915 family protein n=1 Tax=Mycetocola saprophilus TaxID=76636 RepID=UPI00316AE84A
MSADRSNKTGIRVRPSPVRAWAPPESGGAPIIPPVLYLPIRLGPEGQRTIEIHRRADGRTTLLAYTALDRLARQCGESQPWILVFTERLGEIKDEYPFDVVSFDPGIDPQSTTEGQLK